jgi:AcrR family transcriptional regulator
LKRPPKTVRKSANDRTRTQFLDAAERQFASRGYDGATIRAIAEKAGANLGALHYYWGSKQALFREVCERRLRPINEERLRRYRLCEAATRAGKPDVDDLIGACVEPALSVTGATVSERAAFRLFYGRALTDPAVEVDRVMTTIFESASMRFTGLLRRACPDLDDNEFYWRLAGFLGALIYIQSNFRWIEHISRGAFRGDRAENAAGVITHFCAALMKAPPVQPRIRRQRRPKLAKNGGKTRDPAAAR